MNSKRASKPSTSWQSRINNWWKSLKYCLIDKGKKTFYLAVETIVAFFILGFFLWYLGKCFPQPYKVITHWANKNPAPTITGCTFTKIKSLPFDDPDLFEWYDVEILSDTTTGMGTILAYPKNIELIHIQEGRKKLKVLTDKDSNYIVLFHEKFKNVLPPMRIMTQIGLYGDKEIFTGYDCPIRVEFFDNEQT